MRHTILFLFAAIFFAAQALAIEPVITDLFYQGQQQKDSIRIVDTDTIYSKIDIMPEFPSGGSALRKYVTQKLRYPTYALKNRIEGKVAVAFVVNETGEVTNVKAVKGVHESLDQEAVSVVKQMPKWKPGMHNGKAVKVSYVVPVVFSLKPEPSPKFRNPQQWENQFGR